IKYEAVVGKGKKQISFAEVPLEAALDYAAEDADMTGRLHANFKRRLVGERMATVYETIERPLVPVIVEMERAGIRADAVTLKDLSKDFAKRMAELEIKAYELAGEEFNVGSPKQLGEILFDKMGLEGGKKGKTGAYTTSADVLDELAAQGHELPQNILEWRQMQKLKSTYADALVEQINPDTGRVHTSYGMAIAQTGRLSSNDPNLQNIPVRTEEGRKIRAAFMADKGNKLVSLDYSQIELRVVAHVAGEEALIEAFRDGQDIHAMTASQVFNVPIEGMDPMMRRNAKAINFGIIYGISAFGLANNLNIGRDEARDYIAAYFERYPAIKRYMEDTREEAKEAGHVDTIFGRRIHLRGIKDKNQAVRGFAERQAINAPIQGAAADIIKRAMIRVPDALAKHDFQSKMLLQVHDELLFEAPEGEVDNLIEVMRDVMENAAAPAVNMSVPLVADAGVGDTWNEAH
ncbi:MAG: DNA polymerase I, partial [Alphaproteobacteria bacterium]